MTSLKTTFLGIPINNPVVIGSSGLTGNVKNIVALEKAGAAAVVLKSIFEEEIQLEFKKTWNNLETIDFHNQEFLDYYDYEIKKEVINNYTQLIREAKESVSIPVIASINCMGSSEWVNFAKKIEDAGADGIELNIFKLPFSNKLDSEMIEKSYFDIIKSIRSKVNIPIGIKISPFITNLGGFIQKISQLDVQGITLFNRFYNLDFDIEQEKVISGNIFSQDRDYHNTLRWTSLMSPRVKCNLSASTGIHDSETAMKMIYAGATSTQIVSVVYELGNSQIKHILDGIEGWMQRKGYKTIQEFRGKLSQSTSTDPEHYERVQFMKYFGEHH
ncbi:MAG: dihydroorotate dehydrogenase-like protein [Breznakibacter sp.]|nr:dihydroorotate dehydrogenase-like protein [Breznakibacter sp.]